MNKQTKKIIRNIRIAKRRNEKRLRQKNRAKMFRKKGQDARLRAKGIKP